MLFQYFNHAFSASGYAFSAPENHGFLALENHGFSAVENHEFSAPEITHYSLVFQCEKVCKFLLKLS